MPSLEDGELFIIDLAGSENTADTQFHDKQLIKQAQQINKSLMALKECIRNRSLSVVNENTQYHIPYRNSKLTLLLKESFELYSNKHSKTAIIANVSPSVSDQMMTKNTLRFITPIKVGSCLKIDKKRFEPNDENPATWTNEMLREWLKTKSPSLDLDKFCPYESGKQALSIPKWTFMMRLMAANSKLS